MTNSIACFEKAQVILVTGSNTSVNHPIIANRIRRAVAKGTKLIVVDPRDIPLAHIATIRLRQRPGSDVAWLNGLMNVILEEDLWDKQFVEERTEGIEAFAEMVKQYNPERVEQISGIPADDLRAAARLYASGKPASIAYSMGITQHITGTDNVKSIANLAMLCGNLGVEGGGVNPLRGQNNVQGACDMGALPNVFPGYQKVVDPAVREKFAKAWGVDDLPAEVGLTITDILPAAHEGRVRALYIMGENPVLSDPDSKHVEECLEATEFLVVQDLFLTETAKFADVVLPAAGYLERDGTCTNTDRSIQRMYKVRERLEGTRADWEIFCDLATRMGYPMKYESASQIFDEITQVTPQYAGVSYQRLDRGEHLCWPCPTADHPGTAILHKGKFSRGQGLFHAIEYIPPDEQPDETYPWVLTTGRVLAQFHTGTMTRKAECLNQLAPYPFVEVNPSDAEKLGIDHGDPVRVSSRRGAIELAAHLDDAVEAGVLFIPFHYYEAAANVLTNPAHDPICKIPELKVCAARIERTS